MFSDRMKARLAGLALASAVFAVPGVASAGVVVKSTGPSSETYPVGRQVSDSATITLRAGDKITVLTDSGTSVMQGPGTFRVGEGATRTRSRFSSLSRRSSVGRARTGAVRGASPSEGGATQAPTSPPNLWFVNLESSGNVCLYDLNRVRLWRPDASSPQSYTIQDTTTQTTLDVIFVGTETMRAWDPEALPLVAGRSYSITGPLPVEQEDEGTAGESAEAAAAPTTIEVSFATLDGNFREQDQLAQALIDNGCTSQLTQLADELEAFAETSTN